MAEPFDGAAYLEDVSGILQSKYFGEFTEEYPSFHGGTTNALFKPYTEEIVGDGKTLQVEIAPGDSVRWNSDPLAALTGPDVFRETTIKVRYSETAASNDFRRAHGSCQTNLVAMNERGRGSIVDFVERMYNQVTRDYDRKLAAFRHIPSTGRLALVNGTPVEDDNWVCASGTATADNTDGLRCYIDNGSIAAFVPGMRVDFYTAAGALHAGNVVVRHINFGDANGGSIGFQFVATGITSRLSSGDLATVADNDEIYLSGGRNEGIYSFGAYFARPTAGESFIGGVDRTTQNYRWMMPLATREGSASVPITKGHFDDLANSAMFQDPDVRDSAVIMTTPTIHQTLRSDIGEDAFLNIPISDSRMARFMNFGSIGLNYQHPTFGIVKLIADPLAQPNTVRFIVPETWRTLYYGYRGLRPIREAGAHWYRMQDTSTANGKSMIMKADWYGLLTDWCFKPWLNAEIMNVTA